MWIFTKHGFFSCTRVPNDEFGLIQVRARLEKHFVNAKRAKLIPDRHILRTTHSDYKFRVILRHDEFIDMLKKLADEIDYTNFKSECAARRTLTGRYVEALHRVWEIMEGIQR
jgi:hypothetical protein